MSDVTAGPFRVAAILASGALVARLGDLGLRAGERLCVLENRGPSGMVVACGDTRLALDRDTAVKVRVVALAVEE